MVNPLRRWIRFLTVITILTGCNLPADVPTQPFFTTPNQTMTALYSNPPIKIVTATIPLIQTATFIPSTRTDVSPTATINAQSRAGGAVEAISFSAPPAIDADWNDYLSQEYAAEVVVYGLSFYTERNDLAGSFRIGWDMANLYLAIKIRDEKYVQNASGEELFKGDSIEILLDADLQGDFSSRELNGDDYQLGLSMGKTISTGKREAYLWFPLSQKGVKADVRIVATRDDSAGLTRAETAIPWSLFGISPKIGDRFGFALSISDNDDGFTNAQQSLASSVKTRNLVDPTSWGELMLGK